MELFWITEFSRDVKFELAQEIVERFHGKENAKKAQEEFTNRFRHGNLPEDISEKEYPAGDEKATWAAPVCTSVGLTSSNSDFIRMVKSGAVKINGEKISDKDVKLEKGETFIIQVGKRKIIKVKIK